MKRELLDTLRAEIVTRTCDPGEKPSDDGLVNACENKADPAVLCMHRVWRAGEQAYAGNLPSAFRLLSEAFYWRGTTRRSDWPSEATRELVASVQAYLIGMFRPMANPDYTTSR